MRDDVVIRVEGLSKRYRLGTRQRYRTIKEAWSDGVAGLLGRSRPASPGAAGRNGPPSANGEWVWALKDVSFDVRRGDVVGFIGRNGSGKSTLLKVVARITRPTEGCAAVRGRVGSLLEVGTGFHPELTGRENIYLNGAILGMKKVEIDRKFDEIVAFADTERFLDTPVKRYSSGMYVRLAFAIAAHLEPPILIVDEVLAVGDAAFQKKCLGKMRDVARGGRTVLFVSHNMAAVEALCSSALVLDQGEIVARGEPAVCIDAYHARSVHGRARQWVRSADAPGAPLVITGISAALDGTQPRLTLHLDITLESRDTHKPAFLAVDLVDSFGAALMQAVPRLEGFLEHTTPHHRVRVSIALPPLIPGEYAATVWVGSHNTETLDEVKEAVALEIHDSPTPGRSFPHTRDHGYIVPPSTVE